MSGILTIAALLGLAAQAGRELPDWLEGEWNCRVERTAGGQIVRSEHWARDDWMGLTGTVQVGPSGTGAPPSREAFARILPLSGGLNLTYMAGGSTRSYRLVHGGDGELVFEAEDGRAPERIAWRRGEFSLTVTHSRRDGGGAQSWRHARAGIHTGMPDC